jgi:hypothetical protein
MRSAYISDRQAMWQGQYAQRCKSQRSKDLSLPTTLQTLPNLAKAAEAARTQRPAWLEREAASPILGWRNAVKGQAIIRIDTFFQVNYHTPRFVA